MTATPRSLCESCEASPVGCLSLQVLGGRTCCPSCTHTQET